MQDLIGISIPDATQQPRIGESPLECAVLRRQRGEKRLEIAGEDLDASRIDRAEPLLPAENVQRCPPLRPRLREHKRAIGEIEGCQALASRQLCAGSSPMQPPGNHQVKYQPEIVLQSDGDALADSP